MKTKDIATIKRNEDLVITSTYYTRSFSIFIGIALVLSGIAPAAIGYLNPSSIGEDIPYLAILNLSLVFMLAGIFFIYPAVTNATKPRKPLIYNPFRKGRKLIISNIIGAIFVGLFLGTFILIGITSEEEAWKYLIWLFVGIFTLMFGWRVTKGLLYLSKGLRYKVSILECKQVHTYGSQVRGTLINKVLFTKTDQVSVTLRNLTEHPAFGTKHKDLSSNGFLTEIHSATSSRSSVLSERIEFNITVPASGFATEYINNKPTYWELVFENKEVGYFSRFFLEIR